jgi:hypothetical protein
MSARRYSLPECLKDLVPEDQYRKWLQRKAHALVKRDRKRGNPQATIAIYKDAIHRAIHRDGPRDWYTGEELKWHLIGTYRNDVAKRAGRDIKLQMSHLPTVDHEDDGLGEPQFRICGWAVNDAKNDLSLEDFVQLCKKVLAHQQSRRTKGARK